MVFGFLFALFEDFPGLFLLMEVQWAMTDGSSSSSFTAVVEIDTSALAASISPGVRKVWPGESEG